MGGITYEEAKFVAELNKKGANILLGGTNIINSKLYFRKIEITDLDFWEKLTTSKRSRETLSLILILRKELGKRLNLVMEN